MFDFFKKKTKLKAKLYTRCNELCIHNFNEIATNSDFDYLKINKLDQVSDTEIELAWLGILDEYFRLSKNALAINQLKKKTSLLFLSKKLQVFQAMQICIDKGIDVSKELKEYRTDKTRLPIHTGMISNDINRIEKTIPKEESQTDENNFEMTLAMVIENGFQINRHTTMLSEWIAILHRIEQRQKQAK